MMMHFANEYINTHEDQKDHEVVKIVFVFVVIVFEKIIEEASSLLILFVAPEIIGKRYQ